MKLKALVYFIVITLSLIISERGLIYIILISNSGSVVINPYPLSEISNFVRWGVSAFIVTLSLWITNQLMQYFSLIKTKMIKNVS
ncbi:hypothetical protein ABH966_001340 [Lysinibacillus sp. RC46]|uniref:hypothetical protein n=1 Tax=unclassified Lysinibacillus TaxID=2636778 RepID=UPI00351415DB